MLMQSESFHHQYSGYVYQQLLFRKNCCIESSPTQGDDTVIGSSLKRDLEIGYRLLSQAYISERD